MSSEGEKICTGCGWSSLKPLPEYALACCPDNNYVPVNKPEKGSVEWLIGQIQSPEWEQMYIWHKAEIFKIARVMHERDVKNAFIAGSFISETRIPEQYYKDTFQ